LIGTGAVAIRHERERNEGGRQNIGPAGKFGATGAKVSNGAYLEWVGKNEEVLI